MKGNGRGANLDKRIDCEKPGCWSGCVKNLLLKGTGVRKIREAILK